MFDSHNIIMLGATGAVGGEALKALLDISAAKRITLLGRRSVPDMPADRVAQHEINIFEPDTYASLVSGHDVAVCTLGVGEPSKASREHFLKVDKLAVIDFAKACKAGGVKHFELLASIGLSADSSNFYLRSKGELVEELKALNFDRLSIFKPSMIMTPNNRYGFTQAIALAIWPVIDHLLIGGLRKYRGIKVADLGGAMARNIFRGRAGEEFLVFDDFQRLKL